MLNLVLSNYVYFSLIKGFILKIYEKFLKHSKGNKANQ